MRGELEIKIAELFCEMKEVQIQIPALPRPTLSQLQTKHSWVWSIEKDDSPEEPITLHLGTLLRQGEERINSKEYEQRRLTLDGRMLGYQHAEWLVKRQDFPAFKALLGKVYIDFPGIVVADADGLRDFPCLDSGDGRWCLGLGLAGGGLGRLGRLAVSGK